MVFCPGLAYRERFGMFSVGDARPVKIERHGEGQSEQIRPNGHVRGYRF